MTEQKQAAEALRLSEERFRAPSTPPPSAWRSAPDGRFLQVNRVALRDRRLLRGRALGP